MGSLCRASSLCSVSRWQTCRLSKVHLVLESEFIFTNHQILQYCTVRFLYKNITVYKFIIIILDIIQNGAKFMKNQDYLPKKLRYGSIPISLSHFSLSCFSLFYFSLFIFHFFIFHFFIFHFFKQHCRIQIKL